MTLYSLILSTSRHLFRPTQPAIGSILNQINSVCINPQYFYYKFYGSLSYLHLSLSLFPNTILWRMCPLLGNSLVNTFPKNTLSTIEGHQLLSNGPINTFSTTDDAVFRGVRAKYLSSTIEFSRVPRPVLSSERASHGKKNVTVRQK
jgi:hypothetical protein